MKVTRAAAVITALVVVAQPAGAQIGDQRLHAALVRDINPGDALPNGSYPAYVAALGDRLFFSADDGEHGYELWASAGTAQDTALVRDIMPGRNGVGTGPYQLTAVGAALFFRASDGVAGYELWKTDGTIADAVYFNAADGVHGQELWRSTGTEAGTIMVADILPGDAGSAPQYLVALDGRILFAANDGSTGHELWVSDGTPAETHMVGDVWPGSGDGYPGPFTQAGARAFFQAYDGVHGAELWAVVEDHLAFAPVVVRDAEPHPRRDPSSPSLTAAQPP